MLLGEIIGVALGAIRGNKLRSFLTMLGIVIGVGAVITMVAMLVVLYTRMTDKVRSFLSTYQDYFVWLVTFLPVITGYMAFHRILFPYTTMLAVHILTFELLLVVLPFTKLIHTFTLFFARFYNGAISGRKGVQL